MRLALTASVISATFALCACGTRTVSNTPTELDPEVWQLLQSKLAAELGGSSDNKPHLQSAEKCAVHDLTVAVTDYGYLLEWTYKNPGDYNLDGEVNIGDLTTLGLFFGQTTSSESWLMAARADGDQNGIINLADVAPIAANWKASVSGYLLAPELGDGNGNGYVNEADLTSLGRMIFMQQPNVLRIYGFHVFAGPNGDDFNTHVEPGTAGLPGSWIGMLFKSVRHDSEVVGSTKRISYRLGLGYNGFDFAGWQICVAPVWDSGARIPDPAHPESPIVVLPEEGIGPPSNLVTLPGHSE